MKPADSRSEGSAREGNNNNPRIADFIGVTGTGARHSGNHRQPKVPKTAFPNRAPAPESPEAISGSGTSQPLC
jgi:hypothetical protein